MVSLGLPSHNSQVSQIGAWLDCTEGGDLRNLGSMPNKAQRELSASVVSLAVRDFEDRLAAATTPDASRRLVNWRSVCDRRAGRWVATVPWDLGCTERLQTTFANDPNDVNDYLVVCKRNDRLGTPCRESNSRV